MTDNNYCVIMAGGTAGRFWPLTREDRPKQFLDVAGRGRSFLQDTYDRCVGLVPRENVLVITLSRFTPLVREQIPDLPAENLLLEPYGRNTAPCIAYATYSLLKRNPAAVVAVTPSDLVIRDRELFRSTMRRAFDYAASNEVLTTLGIEPSRPDPNFGYIQVVGGKGSYGNDKPMKVKTFTEKPDASLAEVFCRSGEFFWNSGIFLWRASVIRAEMEQYLPGITRLFEGWEGALGSPAEETFLERAYTDCPKQSIDYGVMEKTDRAWLFPVRFDWSDIDNWESLYAQFPGKDGDGIATNARNRYFEDTAASTVLSTNPDKLMVVKGLDGYLVIDTPDALLICPKDDARYNEFIAELGLPGYDAFR